MSDDSNTDTAAEASVEVAETQGDETAQAESSEQPSELVPEPRPEDIIVTRHLDTVLAADGLPLNPNAPDPFIAAIASLSLSPDFLTTQLSIYAYETGNSPLYRFLNGLLNLGEQIKRMNDADLKVSLGNFRAIITNEDALAKTENRKPRGFQNIGSVSIPIINDKYIELIRREPVEVFKLLTRIFFPNASAGLRARYYEVLHFASEKAIPNFVTWLAGEHECTVNGKIEKKFGLTGAYNKIKFVSIEKDPLASIKTDDELNKAFNTNTKETLKKPDWLPTSDKPFFILSQIVNGNLEIVNVTANDPTQIKAAVRNRHGQLFPSDLDYSIGNSGLKMRDAVHALIKFVGPSELILWQDEGSFHLMPTNEQWIDDESPNEVKSDKSLHFAVMLRLYPPIDEKTGDFARFPEFAVFDDSKTYERDIFGVGYTTSQIDKILRFKGEPKFEWANEARSAFRFMGAEWYSSDNRRSLPRTKADDANKRTRQPSCLPYGFQYISGCIIERDGQRLRSARLTDNIDFSQARVEYKKWVEARTNQKLPVPSEVVICVKDGVIGAWFEPVRNDKGEFVYNSEQQLVQIGTCSVTALRGQWRIPVDQMTRVWGLMTSGWSMMIPEKLPLIQYFEEPNLDVDLALEILEAMEDEPYGYMPDLCSTNKDDRLYIIKAEDDGVYYEGKTRLCIPLVLNCENLWVYLYNETR